MSNDDTNRDYTDEELAQMSQDELVKLGTNLDGVDVAYHRKRFPIPGTKAEKRAERTVAIWFIIAGLAAAAFFGIYIWWPWQYKGVGDEGEFMYSLYTPLIGGTMGIAILAVGIGAVHFTKKLIPEEVSIQQRHDGPSPEVDRQTMSAQLQDSYGATGLARRKMLKGTLGFGAVAVGIMAILPLGGLIKNPWKKHPMTNLGDGTLHTSGWTPHFEGEKIFLRRDVGDPHVVEKIRLADLEAGGMETVFPFRESDLVDSPGHPSEEKLLNAMRGSRNPVMLIRLRTEDTTKVIKRKGQVNFNYGDYFAYSKICTHLGCPTSLYEQQTNRILCPCHQSQFDALQWCKPIFGPAARALPQLPITIDEDGYLVANGDFIEPLGPAFWERRS
ncbi:ubiquinol-cytochrome c reductase iron-sulfur subunit [Tomitella cavernea]|uniref:Cytochrome bc1 complex Rieske iron-sulfur subunit n=1 Tax=Tomitella cavernea TaxID=1387982 RepID=A0ABP9CZ71_9ACTN|nr:ubiquinol-cytochrome c reductase iron-sulfur subunit [Tomitella cavernea]